MNTWAVFPEHKLTNRCEFCNSLKDECITEKDNNVKNVFKMNKMSDYHDLYLKKDVLLLADVFLKFISTCLENCGLGHSHYSSSPD